MAPSLAPLPLYMVFKNNGPKRVAMQARISALTPYAKEVSKGKSEQNFLFCGGTDSLGGS